MYGDWLSFIERCCWTSWSNSYWRWLRLDFFDGTNVIVNCHNSGGLEWCSLISQCRLKRGPLCSAEARGGIRWWRRRGIPEEPDRTADEKKEDGRVCAITWSGTVASGRLQQNQLEIWAGIIRYRSGKRRSRTDISWRQVASVLVYPGPWQVWVQG